MNCCKCYESEYDRGSTALNKTRKLEKTISVLIRAIAALADGQQPTEDIMEFLHNQINPPRLPTLTFDEVVGQRIEKQLGLR